MNWIVRQYRLTAFPSSQADGVVLPTWSGMFGTEALSAVRRAGVLNEEGDFNSLRVIVGSQLRLRADLVIQPIPTPDAPIVLKGEGLGSLLTAVAASREILDRFLSLLPPVRRLAVGVVLVRPTQNKEESYALLPEAIKTLGVNLAGTSDFTFQINRPRSSLIVRGLQLNRLAKWAAIRVGVLTVDAASSGVSHDYGEHAIQLELDMSTEADRTTSVPAGTEGPLVKELESLAAEIAAHGDVA